MDDKSWTLRIKSANIESMKIKIKGPSGHAVNIIPPVSEITSYLSYQDINPKMFKDIEIFQKRLSLSIRESDASIS